MVIKVLIKRSLQTSRQVLSALLKLTPVIRKHYRLGRRIDCVTEACKLIDQKHGQIGSHVFFKTIERRLYWLGINFSRLDVRQKRDLYTLLAHQPLQPSRYDELKQECMQAPTDLLSCRQWLSLHEMCCFRGRYTLAQIFREKARQLAIKPLEGKDVNPPISWKNTIGAAIEGGECLRLEDLAQLLQRAGITGDVASKWQLYLAVLNGQNISREWVKQFDKSDFGDYLVGKSISIVGPAPTGALDAEEIDSYDLVVRLNHNYEGKGTDTKHKGLRTDITCFNGSSGSTLMREREGFLPREVAWGCFKSANIVDEIQKKNNNKNARSLIIFYHPQFHGSFNMLQIVALDLALFDVKKIKIFHSDLMLTVRRQIGYSISSSKCTEDLKKRFTKSSIIHDPIQQYVVLHKLWINEKITGDARFVEVMQVGLDAYLRELERTYANPHAQLGPSNA